MTAKIIKMHQDIYDNRKRITMGELEEELHEPTVDDPTFIDIVGKYQYNYALTGVVINNNMVEELEEVGLYINEHYTFEDVKYYLKGE